MTNPLSPENIRWWNGLNGQWQEAFCDYLGLAESRQFQLEAHLPDVLAMNFMSVYFFQKDLRTMQPLAKFPQISWIDIGQNQIEEIIDLRPFHNLAFLDINGNPIRNHREALAPLATVRGLDLQNTQLQTLDFLGRLTGLNTLYLGNDPALPYANALDDFQPLRNLRALRTLGLDYLHLTHLDDLSGLGELRALQLSGNPGLDLAPLEALPRLEKLTLNHCDLSDLAVLARLPNLKILELSHNHIADIGALAGLENLLLLDLSHNQIRDFGPILDLPNAENIDIRANGLDANGRRALAELKRPFLQIN